jgi:hypothetical protein
MQKPIEGLPAQQELKLYKREGVAVLSTREHAIVDGKQLHTAHQKIVLPICPVS